jgi:hypothetical protein
MARGLTDPIEPEEQQQDGPSLQEIMEFMDRLALHTRDLETRLNTIEKNLFVKPEKKWKRGL